MEAVLIALASGFCGGLGGVGYKVSNMGKVSTLQAAAVIAFFGALFFGVQACHQGEWALFSWQVAGLALASGFSQYLALVLFAWALKKAPLSLVWCASSLEFMPGLLFAWLAYDEPMSYCRWAGLVALLGAIVVASFAGGEETPGKEQGADLPPEPEKPSASRPSVPTMLATLIALPLLFGGLFVCMKWGSYLPAPGAPEKVIMDATGNIFMCLVYFTMMVTCACHVTATREWNITRLGAWGCALATIPTVASFFLQLCIVVEAPAAVVFALTYSMSMFSTAILSTLFLGERRTRTWYATLGLALLAVVLISDVLPLLAQTWPK
ncbi:MAG: EamA family transporter [Oligosphaeraceae bacterium]